MFPYIHTPHYKFGPFTLQAFGMLVASGVIIGSILIRRWTEEQKLDLDMMIDSFFVVIPGGFMLSHVVNTVLYSPELIAKNPLVLIYFWQGISSFGGFLGGGVVAFFYFKYWRKVDPLPYMDTYAYGTVFGFFFGRMGCMVAHDHAGMWVVNNAGNPRLLAAYQSRSITLPGWDNPLLWIALLIATLSVGLVISRLREKPMFESGNLLYMLAFAGFFAIFYPFLPDFIRVFTVHWPMNWSQLPKNGFALVSPPTYTTKLRFDLGLMEAFYFLFLVAIVYVIKTGKPRREGMILGTWFVLYAPIRFLFDFLRLGSSDNRSQALGLTPGQFMAMLTFGLGVYFLVTLPDRRWGEYGEEQERKQAKKSSKEKKKDAPAKTEKASATTGNKEDKPTSESTPKKKKKKKKKKK